MANTDTFSGYHPTVNFIYFALVLFFGMIFMHPACLAIALFGAAAYAVRLKGRKAAGFGVKFILPVVLLAVVINPVFNHAGETVLSYLSNGNPITKRASHTASPPERCSLRYLCGFIAAPRCLHRTSLCTFSAV